MTIPSTDIAKVAAAPAPIAKTVTNSAIIVPAVIDWPDVPHCPVPYKFLRRKVAYIVARAGACGALTQQYTGRILQTGQRLRGVAATQAW